MRKFSSFNNIKLTQKGGYAGVCGRVAGPIDVNKLTPAAIMRQVKIRQSIANGVTDLIASLFYHPTRAIVVESLYLIPDVAISNHATGALIVGVTGDTDALVASTALQNITAGTLTALTLASTLVSALAEARGGAIVPAATRVLATSTALAAGGTGIFTLMMNYFFLDSVISAPSN